MSDGAFDLGTATSVPLSVTELDAAGAAIEPPVAPAWKSDDEMTLSLTDNGDGTVTAVRVSALGGTVTVHATVNNPDGSSATGSLAISLTPQAPPPVAVVADVAIVPGTPTP